MNIHCIVTLTILLLVASLCSARAQFSWDNAFGYHRRSVDYDSLVIEIRHPHIVRIVDDDYTHSLRRLHLFQPFDPPTQQPIIYLPRIHFAPEVYIEEHYPYDYNRFEEPVSHPYRTRLLTTVSLSYRAKILPVIDYNDEDKDTVADSLPSDTNTVAKTVTKSSNNESKATKKDSNVGKNTTKGTTPKPNLKAESVTKPEAEKKPEAKKKPETENNPVSDKTTETSTNEEVTNVDETEKPAEEEIKTSETINPDTESDSALPEKSDGESVPTETSDGDTTNTEEPAPVPTE